MNCESFFNDLFEYVDGRLAPPRRREADEHLAGCDRCRQVLLQEKLTASALSTAFQQRTKSMVLPADFAERLITTLQMEAGTKVLPLPQSPAASRWRLAWPAALAACALFMIFPPGYFAPAPASPTAVSPPDMSVHFVYCSPTYTFRQEDGRVVDALVCEPHTVDLTFHRDNQKPL